LERQTLHVMDDKRRVVMVESKTIDSSVASTSLPVTVTRYQFDNHLGSACLELDDSAVPAIISYEEYYPYGNTSYQAVNSAIEVSSKRYRYTGKERDDETGFYYHGARYYASWLGRWISCDPLVTDKLCSKYSYANGNPARLTDSTGRAPGPPAPPPSPLEFEGEARAEQVKRLAASKAPAQPADKHETTGGEAALRGIAFGVSDLTVAAFTAPLGLDEEGNFSFEALLMQNPILNPAAPILGLVAIGKDLVQGFKKLGSGENDEEAARQITRGAVGAALVAAGADETLSAATHIDIAPAIIEGAREGVAPPEFIIPPSADTPPVTPATPLVDADVNPVDTDVNRVGPAAPTGTLNPDVGPFQDPTGRTYKGDLRPDDPVLDHVGARAAGGDPIDPKNQDVKSRESNAIKGGREGALLRYEETLRAAGMSEEDIQYVTGPEWRSIMVDVHAAPVDPFLLTDF
jgi:RHS repeat-associated protein